MNNKYRAKLLYNVFDGARSLIVMQDYEDGRRGVLIPVFETQLREEGFKYDLENDSFIYERIDAEGENLLQAILDALLDGGMQHSDPAKRPKASPTTMKEVDVRLMESQVDIIHSALGALTLHVAERLKDANNQ